jgi:hypothetical protein
VCRGFKSLLRYFLKSLDNSMFSRGEQNAVRHSCRGELDTFVRQVFVDLQDLAGRLLLHFGVAGVPGGHAGAVPPEHVGNRVQGEASSLMGVITN